MHEFEHATSQPGRAGPERPVLHRDPDGTVTAAPAAARRHGPGLPLPRRYTTAIDALIETAALRRSVDPDGWHGPALRARVEHLVVVLVAAAAAPDQRPEQAAAAVASRISRAGQAAPGCDEVLETGGWPLVVPAAFGARALPLRAGRAAAWTVPTSAGAVAVVAGTGGCTAAWTDAVAGEILRVRPRLVHVTSPGQIARRGGTALLDRALAVPESVVVAGTPVDARLAAVLLGAAPHRRRAAVRRRRHPAEPALAAG
jgi:hypothetical protein